MTDKLEKPVILFPINANPLHIGHIIEINLLLTLSSKLHVVLYDRTVVLPAYESKLILDSIFIHYVDRDKIDISVCEENFTKISEIPKKFRDDETIFTIATTSRHVYANLESKGYPYLIMITRPLGWRDEYYTIAYMRSKILNHVEMQVEKMRK